MSITWENADSRVRKLMQGAYDLHAHPHPSHFSRCLDDFQFARDCDAYGMGGAMLKSHYEPTAGRAVLCNAHSGAKATMYGGVALNQPVGGLNPYQVESTLKMGGIIVWLPTRDAWHVMSRGGKATDFLVRPPVEVLDAQGKPRREIYEIFEIMKKYDAWLATGHISPTEAGIICREGCRAGVNMILTHPDSKTTGMPLEEQIALANMGVLIEKVWDNVLNAYISAEDMARSIKAIGAAHCFMATDNGQKGKHPVQGMYDFIAAMLEQGITEEEIRRMVRDNPLRVIRAAGSPDEGSKN